MGAAPLLDGLAVRKRLVLARMELHRAEMAVHVSDLLAPLRPLQTPFAFLARHRAFRWAAVAAVGFLVAARRTHLLRKAAAFVVPLLLSRLRGFIFGRAASLAMGGIRRFWRRS